MWTHDKQVIVEQFSEAIEKKRYGGIEYAIECALLCFHFWHKPFREQQEKGGSHPYLQLNPSEMSTILKRQHMQLLDCYMMEFMHLWELNFFES